MGPRTRTGLALLFTVLVCSAQWLFGLSTTTAALCWLAGALGLLGLTLAINAREMRAAGVPIGLAGGRRLPTAGLNLAFVATLAIAGLTVAGHLSALSAG